MRRTWRAAAVAVVGLVAVLLAACSGSGGLFRQYEYEEEIYLSLDGRATVYVNTSIAALNALRGTTFDASPAARVDTTAVRAYYSSPATRVIRVSQSRRNNRRFVHVRLDVDDVTALGGVAPFAWSRYQFKRDGDLFKYLQTVGAAAAADVGNVGWNGSEIVAFRLHLPARIRFHTAPSRRVERGNLLEWEQSLADRMKGVPIRMEARMDQESILYTTLTLFAVMAVLVVLVFAVIIWMVVRKGRRKLGQRSTASGHGA